MWCLGLWKFNEDVTWHLDPCCSPGQSGERQSAQSHLHSNETFSLLDEIRFPKALFSFRDCDLAVSGPLCAPSPGWTRPLSRCKGLADVSICWRSLLSLHLLTGYQRTRELLCAGGVGCLFLAEGEETGLGTVWAIVTSMLREDPSVQLHRLSLGGLRWMYKGEVLWPFRNVCTFFWFLKLFL